MTGNPEFDKLLKEYNSNEVNEIRKLLNLNSKDKLILWACPPSNVENNSPILERFFLPYSFCRKKNKL